MHVGTTTRRGIGAGLRGHGPNHSVLNALWLLLEDPEALIYLPDASYTRAGEQARDPRVLEGPSERTLTPFAIVTHDRRLNFSIRTRKQVRVRSQTPGERPFAAEIWRTYNVIRDGKLVLWNFEASLGQATFERFIEARIIEPCMYDPSRSYAIGLDGLRLISPAWANPVQLKLIDNLRLEQDLEHACAQLKRRINELKAAGAKTASVRSDSAGLPVYHEQPEDSGRPVQTYKVTTVCYRLLKYRAVDCDLGERTLDQAQQALHEVKSALGCLRFKIRAVTFAMERVGSKLIPWGSPRQSDHKLEQTADYRGASLKRVTKLETFTRS